MVNSFYTNPYIVPQPVASMGMSPAYGTSGVAPAQQAASTPILSPSQVYQGGKLIYGAMNTAAPSVLNVATPGAFTGLGATGSLAGAGSGGTLTGIGSGLGGEFSAAAGGSGAASLGTTAATQAAGFGLKQAVPIAGGLFTAYNIAKAGMSGNKVGPISGAAQGAISGAMIGSVVPVVGTAVGAIVGGIVGALGGMLGPSHPQARVSEFTAPLDAEGKLQNVSIGSESIGGDYAKEFSDVATNYYSDLKKQTGVNFAGNSIRGGVNKQGGYISVTKDGVAGHDPYTSNVQTFQFDASDPVARLKAMQEATAYMANAKGYDSNQLTAISNYNAELTRHLEGQQQGVPTQAPATVLARDENGVPLINVRRGKPGGFSSFIKTYREQQAQGAAS